MPVSQINGPAFGVSTVQINAPADAGLVLGANNALACVTMSSAGGGNQTCVIPDASPENAGQHLWLTNKGAADNFVITTTTTQNFVTLNATPAGSLTLAQGACNTVMLISTGVLWHAMFLFDTTP